MGYLLAQDPTKNLSLFARYLSVRIYRGFLNAFYILSFEILFSHFCPRPGEIE